MKIYFVDRTDRVGYDEYDAAIVYAKSPKEAKRIFMELEGEATLSTIVVKYLGTAASDRKSGIGSKSGVILGSYNAG